MTIVTIQPNETDALDAFIANGTYQSNNYGTHASLFIGRADSGVFYRGCIQFDFAVIPAGAIIDSAKLNLTVNVAGELNNTVAIHRLLVDWSESQVTWLIRKTGTNWKTAGGFDDDDCEQTAMASKVIESGTAVGTKITFNLPVSTIQDMVDGKVTNNGFLIKGTEAGTSRITFFNSNAATESQRPSIDVEYFFPQGIIIL